jgi:hypothetical protein
MPTSQQHPLVQQLYFDGWYSIKGDAQAVADLVAAEGATPLGLLEGRPGTWGVLYCSPRELFYNHVLNGESPLWSPL